MKKLHPLVALTMLHDKMTYTAIRDFTAQGVNFTKGQKVNRTEYIALTAEERANFKPSDPKPLSERKKKDWDKHYFNWN